MSPRSVELRIGDYVEGNFVDPATCTVRTMRGTITRFYKDKRGRYVPVVDFGGGHIVRTDGRQLRIVEEV